MAKPRSSMKLSTRIFWALSALGGLWAIFMAFVLTPGAQRLILYSTRASTLLWDDLYRPQDFGFAKGQAVPFNVTTPDGETLFAWHILPMNLYQQHEADLRAEYEEGNVPYSQSLAFKLAHEDLQAKVVVSFHGSAGHLANGHRVRMYRAMSIGTDAHVIAFDYRGFGRSTGSPDETGVITDGIAVVNFVLNDLLVPSERIVLVGQSLGTGIATATALHFSDPQTALKLLPEREIELVHKTHRPAGDFAGIVVIASYTSTTSLAKTFRLFGFIPILSPVRFYPWIEDFMLSHIADTLDSETRLGALVRASVARTAANRFFSVHLIHAVNDAEIPWWHSQGLFRAAAQASRFPDSMDQEVFEAWCADEQSAGRGDKLRWVWGEKASLPGRKSGSGEVVFEKLQKGGHNHLASFVHVPLAVRSAFSRIDALDQGAAA